MLLEVRCGATTVWEHWGGEGVPGVGLLDHGMNSFNHYSFGSQFLWVLEHAVGVTPTSPGYDTIRVAPLPPSSAVPIKAATVTIETQRGRIRSGWEITEAADGRRHLTLTVEIPPNVKAEVVVPGGGTHTVGSGTYTFAAIL